MSSIVWGDVVDVREDSPEDFVSTIKEFHLENNDELLALQGAGVHPLKVLGVEV